MHRTQPQSAADCTDPSLESPPSILGRHGLSAGAGLCLLAAVSLSVAPFWLRHAKSGTTLPADESPLRVVSTTRPARAASGTLTLPANIDAFQTTLIYSRVNGYLRRWNYDIGAHVREGQVLAEIDTPEADQELEQARANLVQGKADLNTAIAELHEAEVGLKQADADIARAQANLEFSRGVLVRNEQLSRQHAIALQDLDDSRRDRAAKQADLDSTLAQRKTRESTMATCAAKIKSHEATVQSLEANVRRLERQQEFKTIRAPFAGIVTRRRAEIGSLVTSGSGTSCPELFAVAQVDRLRIRIDVPQSQAVTIHTGQSAPVAVPEYPGRTFTATVARTSGAIDPVSRTLAVELELPNADEMLLPGTFAQVALPVRRADAVCTIPTNALLSRSEGLLVAVVDAQNLVNLRKVALGRDYGRNVEVLSGLQGREALVINPPDNLADHEKVTLAGPTDVEVGSRHGGNAK